VSRWLRDRSLHLALGPSGWVLSRPSGEVARGDSGPQSLLAVAAQIQEIQLPEEPVGAALFVTIDDQWVRSFAVQPPADARHLAELKQCAALRFESLYGQPSEGWLFRANWRPSRSFVVSALQRCLLDAVDGLCRRHRWRLRSVLPAWVRAVAAEPWPPEAQWWAAASGQTLTVLRTQAARVSHVRTTVLPTDLTPEAARPFVQLEQARLLEPAAPLRWIGAAAPFPTPRTSGELDRLDFARNSSVWRLPMAARVWPTAAATVLAAAVAGVGWQQWQELALEHERSSRRLAELSAQAARARAAPAPAPAYTPAQADALNAAARRLETPWPAIFRAIELATPTDVALLTVEPDAHHARIRGSALARSPRHMFEHIERLAATQAFVDARLLRHETDDLAPGKPLRFQFEATLRRSAER